MLSHLCDSLIHFLYDPADCQHGSQAFLIHILADMSTSIDGGSGIKPLTHLCHEHSALYHLTTAARLIRITYLGDNGPNGAHIAVWVFMFNTFQLCRFSVHRSLFFENIHNVHHT